MNDPALSFLAEIKQVNMRKTSSGDVEYKLVLITNNPQILSLAALKPEHLIQVDIRKPKEAEPKFS